MAYPDRHKGWAIVYGIVVIPMLLTGAIGLLLWKCGEWTFERVTAWLDYFQWKMWGEDV